MDYLRCKGQVGLRTIAGAAWLATMLAGAGTRALSAQGCTTQSKMTSDVRTSLSEAATTLAQAVMAGDAARVQGLTVAEYASGSAFNATEGLVQTVSRRLTGDSLAVTQMYVLNARNRKVGDGSDADFSCALAGTTSETDFSISGLPPGTYAFVMVEASGARPWLLSFLMRQDGEVWKMAGFYPKARTAAGHDGGWYWNEAWKDGQAKDSWLAWVLFGEADQLLRPASFVTSTKLDVLRSEQRSTAPPELANGVDASTPLMVKGNDGASYSFTAMEAEGSEDGTQLNLELHLRSESIADTEAAKTRARAAVKAVVDAHKELRQGFSRVLVFSEVTGQSPLVTEERMQEIL